MIPWIKQGLFTCFKGETPHSKDKLEMSPSQLQMLEKSPALNHNGGGEKNPPQGFITSMWLTQKIATHIHTICKVQESSC